MPKGIWIRTPEYKKKLSKLFSANPAYLVHGHTAAGQRTPTYNSWRAMWDRCTQPGHTKWHRYGGRGIKVCERWLNFDNFLDDMGERPIGHTLGRYPNPDGDYKPSNCRWETPRQQAETNSGCFQPRRV